MLNPITLQLHYHLTGHSHFLFLLQRSSSAFLANGSVCLLVLLDFLTDTDACDCQIEFQLEHRERGRERQALSLHSHSRRHCWPIESDNHHHHHHQFMSIMLPRVPPFSQPYNINVHPILSPSLFPSLILLPNPSADHHQQHHHQLYNQSPIGLQPQQLAQIRNNCLLLIQFRWQQQQCA